MRALSLVLTLIASAGANAQIPAPVWQRIELGTGSAPYPFAIYSNRRWSDDMSTVKSVVLVFHGLGRNGDNYYAAAEKLLEASGGGHETLLIAPNFFAAADAKRHPIEGMPLWRRSSDWNSGRDAVNWPQPLSSFQPLDDLLITLSDRKRFPQVQRIMLAGHSAGGQFVHRYAVLNPLDEKIRAAGIALRYVIANPSSYLYLTKERPLGLAFAAYDAGGCPDYNDYRYGLENLLPYAVTVNGADLFRRYAAREVVYLLGTNDNNPNHSALDNSCGAKAGGAHRLERGRNYGRYERHLAGSMVKLNRRAYEVIDVGHSQSRMFGSKCAAYLLFRLPEEKNESGAACRAAEF